MRARLHDFNGSQESANVFRYVARAGAWAGITDNDALEEKLQSRLKRIVQRTASAFSPVYWRMCPRAGTVPLAFAVPVQRLIRLLQLQIIVVTRIAHRMAAPDASGTSNALAPRNQVCAQIGSFQTSCAVKGK
jgi:hypothetical protein